MKPNCHRRNLTSRLQSLDHHCHATAPQCLDVLVLYHEDDQKMLIDNGGMAAAMKHLKGIRQFFVLSLSNATLG